MPIIAVPPPPEALFAFSEGLAWLSEVDGRFRNLELAAESEAGRLPPPHTVNLIPLDREFSIMNAPQAWRFCVRNKQIPLGVVDVVSNGTNGRKVLYEFLAFREGPPIVAMVGAYQWADEFSKREMTLGLVKVPALGSNLLWLSDEQLDLYRFSPADLVLAIPPRLHGFSASLIPAPQAARLIIEECERVQATPFVQALARGDSDGFNEPPPTATAG